MTTRLYETIDTLLWIGAGLVAAVLAPVLLLVNAAADRILECSRRA